MEISNLYFHNQRNAAHYQFHSDFCELVEKFTATSLGIEAAYAVYHALYVNEGIALVAISKSATTEQIDVADGERDTAFRGMVDEVRSKQNHFKPEVSAAAKRILVILDAYGNLAPKSNDEQSGLTTSLIDDLRTKVGADLATVGVVEWIVELERLNNEFIVLESTRNSEVANRTELKMKQVRIEVDEAYRKIVKRINALIEIGGETPYAEFVKELNVRIARAQESIAMSRAKRTAKTEPTKTE